MADRRIKSVTAKVTEDDYKKCLAVAGKLSVSEWNRGLVLRELARVDTPPVEQSVERVMAELWALRYILVNGIPEPANIATFIQEADQKKAHKARAILEGAR